MRKNLVVNSVTSYINRQVMAVIIGVLVASAWPVEVLAQANLRDIQWQKSSANGAGQDSCEGKDHCLVVVVAPWCPYCKRSLPMIRVLQSKAESTQAFGLRIVVSGDQPDALENEARVLGNFTFVDASDQVMDAGGFDGYPTWAALDRDGNVIRSRSGAYADPTQCDMLLTGLGITF